MKIKPYLAEEQKKKNFVTCSSVFDCLLAIFQRISWIEYLDNTSLNQLVDTLLIHHLNSKTVKIINFLSDNGDPVFVRLVRSKMNYVLNEILHIKNKKISQDEQAFPDDFN